jgi:hypothetical protein
VKQTRLAAALFERQPRRLATIHDASLARFDLTLLERKYATQRNAIQVTQVVVQAVVHAAQLVRLGDDLLDVVDRRAVLVRVQYHRREAFFDALRRVARHTTPRTPHVENLGRYVILDTLLLMIKKNIQNIIKRHLF